MAIFSLVERTVLEPLAYRQPARLLFVREVVPRLQNVYPTMPVNIQHFKFWREHSRALPEMAAFVTGAATLTGGGEPQLLDSAEVTANLFSLLGVKLQAGRSFLAAEEQPGRNRVAILTDRLWRQRFGASPAAVGGSVDLDGVPHTIVGILPPSFRFPRKDDLGPLAPLGDGVELFRPLGAVYEGWGGDFDYSVFARLRPGATPAQARAELDLLENQIDRAHQVAPGLRVAVRPLQEVVAGSARSGLYALLAGVALLLLIVCVNLANLVLARAASRTRELSIRLALGAPRSRLRREIFLETILLAGAGGVLGTLAAGAALRAFVVAAPVDIPRLDEVSLDAGALLFALALAVGCGLLTGLLPARRIAATDPQTTLRSAGPTSTESRPALRLREALVGCEVGLSTMLLVLAVLLAGSLFHLLQADRGFSVERAIAVTLRASYPSKEQRTRFFARTLEQLRAMPGVRSAAFVSKLPLTGETMVNHIQLEGADEPAADPGSRDPIEVNLRFVSADYFTTLGIPLLRGRAIEAGDADRAVAVVSARLAAKLWPGRDPIGRRFSSGSGVGKVEVVGIVKDVHSGRIEHGLTLMAYVPFWRRGLPAGEVVVRTAMAPSSVMPAVRRRIWSIDSAIAVPRLRTMAEIVADAVSPRRFQMQLAAGFAFAALLLAALGIYGLVAYGVAQRRAEIGVRMALGAGLPAVVRLILERGLRPVLLGLAAGLAAAVGCGRLLRSLLFGVAATDPAILFGVALALAAIATAACLQPALAAARTDPARVLRER